jgi:excisionase family DNA binding protein
MPVKRRTLPVESVEVTPAQPASVSIINLPRLLTISEAAKVLGVSVRTVHNIISKRQLTYFKVQNALRFEPAHLDEYLQRRIVRARAA